MLILLNRLADAGIDLGGLNPFLWRRRRAWRGKFEANPIFLLEDPKDIAAVLAVGVAKIDGDMSSEEKRALVSEFESTFAVNRRGATELLGSSAYLLADPQMLLTQLDAVLAKGRDKFTSEQVVSTLTMLERVSKVAGQPSERQRQLIEGGRSRLSHMRPATSTWSSRRLAMRCSVRHLSSRRLQELQAAPSGFGQQAARRAPAAADRGRWALC